MNSILRTTLSGLLLALAFWMPADAHAQTIRGQLLDAENGVPVGLAGVFILGVDRDVLVGAASDTAGFYSIDAPDVGEYYLYIQRIGYFENETPLFQAEAGRTYTVDFEMRPEPFRIDPLSVTVQNEELEDFLTLQFGRNPNSLFGYRAYQGTLLQQAKLGATDNTDILRRLHIMVSHGRQVCINSFLGVGMPSRNGLARASTPDLGETIGDGGEVTPRAEAAGTGSGCGALFLDGYRVPNELVEELEMESVAVVVTLPGTVRLYTRDFDWTMKPGGGGLR